MEVALSELQLCRVRLPYPSAMCALVLTVVLWWSYSFCTTVVKEVVVLFLQHHWQPNKECLSAGAYKA